MRWILIVIGIVLALVAVFALQNPTVVNLRFLNLSADASVLVVILISYAAGIVTGILALLPSSIRKTGRMLKMGSELKAAQSRKGNDPPAPAVDGRGRGGPEDRPPL